MAPSMKSTRETIQAGLSSVEKCSPDILGLLRDLLNPALSKALPSKAASKPIAASRTTKVKTSRKPNEETPDCSTQSINQTERIRLATETVNNSLRTLTELAKQKSTSATQTTIKPLTETQGKIKSVATTTKNPVASTAKDVVKRTTIQPSSNGTTNVVDCCRTAITYLYTVPGTDLPSFTVESAHSTLIGKIIALSDYDLAMKELLILKRRLVEVLDMPSQKSKALDSFKEILTWTQMPKESTPLSLVIACQLNALRLISAKKDMAVTECLRETLLQSNCLVQAIVLTAPQTAVKAIRNIENLAALVASCAPYPTNVDTDKSWRAIPFVRLNLLAQEYKLKAFDLQPAELREKSLPAVWDAIYRCVLTFSRRALQTTHTQNYEAFQTSFRPLLNILLIGNNGPEDSTSIQKYFEIIRTAANLAQDAGLWAEGIEWTDKAVNFLGFRNENDAARVACQVRIATLAMKSILSSSPVDNALDEVSSALKLIINPFSGSKDDVERLLQDTMIFRRSAMTYIAQQSQNGEVDEVAAVCTDVAYAMLSFFRRWLKAGMFPDGQEKRIVPMGISIVDSIISLLRIQFQPSNMETWKLVDLKLQECLATANLLPSENIDNPQESLFVKIASAYQMYAAVYKKANDLKAAILAMRKSVSALADRPIDELITGNIASKHDRIATYYHAFHGNNSNNTREHLILAFQAWSATGSLTNAAQASHLSGSSETTAISRAFALYVKCLDGKSSLWDDETASVEVRGYVLETQVRLCLTAGTLENRRFAQYGLAILLSLYTFDYPVRRARTMATYLQLAFDCPEYIDPEPVIELAQEVLSKLCKSPDLGEDSSLYQQLDFTLASIRVMIGMLTFTQENPKPKTLQQGLDAWKLVFDSSKDERDLRIKMYDCEGTAQRLEGLVSFLEFKGFSVMRVVALECLLVIKSLTETAVEDLVKYSTMLGMQYLRLGYSGKAGRILAKAQERMDCDQQLSTVVKLQWHLAYTEYLIMIGKPEIGFEHIELTHKLVDEDEHVLEAAKSGAHFRKRVDLNCLLAKASYVLALLHFEKGDANAALTHAKRNDKLLKRAWAGLEAIANRKRAQEDEEMSNITNGVARMSTSDVPKVITTTLEALSGPLLWPIVYALYSGLVLISSLYLHQGMSREAEFYLEQAKQTADAVESKPLLVHALTVFGDLKIRRGSIDNGKSMLEDAAKLKDELLEKGKELVALDCSLGNMYRKIKIWDLEFDAYVNAEGVLEELMTDVVKRPRTADSADILPTMAKLTLEDAPKSKPFARGRSRSIKAKAPVVKEAVAPLAKSTSSTKEQNEWKYLLKMKGNILRSKAVNLAMQQKCEMAEEVLQQAETLPSGAQEVVAQRMAIARMRLIQAIEMMNEDPVYNALQESAVSIPSIVSVKPAPAPTETKSAKKPARGAKSKAVVQVKEDNSTSEVVKLLSEARDNVMEVQLVASKVCSTSMAENVASLYSGINLLLAAVSSGQPIKHQYRPVYSLEMQKSIASSRERHAIAEEKFEDQTKEELTWPALRPSPDDYAKFDLDTFQQTYIDIIPPTWAAVSVSLVGDNNDELYITRFQAGQKPFLLRIPLKRESLSEDEETTFVFKNGLEELRNVIAESNISTHNAKEMTSNGARAVWWEQREILDTRLKDLLQNIEDVWLGGFKGMLRTHVRHGTSFAKFKVQFNKILEEHLASRQGNSKSKAPMVKLDPRIIELFLSIGNPNEEEVDLDNLLLDLIYFVVDILKFHGENIAFDEVDETAMTVELTDIIGTYHESISHSPDEDMADHTILILDKSVHMFPWESLPCLQGHAVSRLPSLASLRERILQQQESMAEGAKDGLYIDRQKGSYILNPGNDLVSTQKVFGDELKALLNWTSISQRPPTESEFKASLEKQDLFLYFGHGNGGQYIRSRTVRKLDRCAVALLLGCSSGKLEDAGEYEPWGAPVNYLHAGCPSLVVTLWDVTDKDIDRFSKTVFEKWGLFENKQAKPVVKKASSKGKQKVVAPVEEAESVSLVKAVSEGRKSCKLRYLNGAAPIVYGIPVYFK